jgi:nucleoside-diphosphate-sugar epimerase
MIVGLTGGMGLIGKALRQKLEMPVVLLVRGEAGNLLKKNETVVVGNFSDKNVSEKFVSGLNILIHAATGVGPRSEFEDRFVQDDLVGTINLAKTFFAKNPDGHFIYLSTAGGLYDLDDHSIKIEESELNPTSLYGAIKLIIENSLEGLGIVTILRPAPIYGDSFKKNKTTGLIDKLLYSTIDESVEGKVVIFDRLESARDYLHVDDMVQAVLKVMDRNLESSFEIYNVGSGVETSIEDVIKLVNEISEKKVRVEIQMVSKEPTSLIVDSRKLFTATGWETVILLKDGIRKMYNEII